MGSKKASFNAWLTCVITALVVAGGFAQGAPRVRAQDDAGIGVTTIIGTLSADLAQNPYGYMVLNDLTGFVKRDFDHPPSDYPVLGWVDGSTGAYRIDLPIAPAGRMNDVGNGQGHGPGVQIFSVDPYYDAVLDPRPGMWEAWGWAWTDSSMVTSPVTHEVTGGRLVVWAPDDQQFFSTDFGADGKLFTADDPTSPIPASWTVVDLEQRPFGHIRTAQAEILPAKNDLQPLDFSQLGPVEAFDKLVEVLSSRYPLPVERPIDWDGLRQTFRPAFEAAETSGDPTDFVVAVNEFIIAVGVRDNYTIVPWDRYLPQLAGSTGLHVDMTDDGRVIVVAVEPGQPAELAGIQPGAEIVSWNGVPARDAVDARPQYYAGSSPQNILRHRLIWFGREPAGAAIEAVFLNPGKTEPAQATLTAVEIPDEDVFFSVFCFRPDSECKYQTPVTVEWLPSGVAVIRVQYFGSDAQDVRLIGEAWDRAVTAISNSDAKGLIIDVRNAGPQIWYALPMYMAGSFFTETIPVAEVTGVDEAGQRVYEGTFKIRPNPVAWSRPVALLVDEFCEGNCELFVQAMTHKPDAIIVGMTATAGTVVTGYQSVLLPADDFVNLVAHALRDPVTHEPIIQGTGIEPTLLVPKTAETVMADVTGDPVRDAAEQALLAGAT